MHSTHRILTIGIAAALAAGCGGGGGGDSAPAASAPPAPPVANTAPTVSTEQLVVVTSGAPATISATGNDADGDTLSYSWTQTSGMPVNSPQGASSASYSFTPAAGLRHLSQGGVILGVNSHRHDDCYLHNTPFV